MFRLAIVSESKIQMSKAHHSDSPPLVQFATHVRTALMISIAGRQNRER